MIRLHTSGDVPDADFKKILSNLYSSLKRQVFVQELSHKELVFIYGNDKLKKIYTFSLPAGHSCPGAEACLSKAGRYGNGLVDGPNCEFRCFAASEEARLTEVRLIRWHNMDKLKSCLTTAEIVNLIQRSLPDDAETIRIHVSGDYYNRNYFQAWIEVARLNPGIVFYSYTKSIPLLIDLKKTFPSNFRVTASFGGRWDSLIIPNNLFYSKVVKDTAEAVSLGLEVDDDDSHAIAGDASFALIIHATQPPGSAMARAWTAIIMAKRNEPKLPKRQMRRSEKTVLQWIAQIYRMAARLRAAGGTILPQDLIVLNDLQVGWGVPSALIGA
jgi:hypothetical protein